MNKIRTIADRVELNNGVLMPWLGLGSYQGRPEDGEHVENAVKTAIAAGYRSIDTAADYANEPGVGRAVRSSGVPREEIFITTKIWNSEQGYDSALRAFEQSLKRLEMDAVDLLLIHWPVKGKYKDTWRALETIYAEGTARAIGVSNFHIHHLEDLLTIAEVVPAVNQVEFHPRLNQAKLHRYCKEHHIQLEAWSPLMLGRLMDHPTIMRLAAAHRKTPAQIILRWDLQKEVVTIPKSVRPERIIENAELFDFELSADDMEQIDHMNQDLRTGPDPDHFDF